MSINKSYDIININSQLDFDQTPCAYRVHIIISRTIFQRVTIFISQIALTV